jgi:hypothetical protein
MGYFSERYATTRLTNNSIKMKKVVIAGGTGFIGSYLTTRFREEGFVVRTVSRSGKDIPWKSDDLTKAFESADLILNLAGKNINCRHTEANKKAIIKSRTGTTQLIGEAIKACHTPPKLWINASAAGIYKSSYSTAMTEAETKLNHDFLGKVVSKWEKSFFEFRLASTRQIALRTSVVLGKNGGALTPLVKLSRIGLGGQHANGKQMFSWIHIEDYFQILLFFVENPTLQGIFNCTSPYPLTNKDFMRELRNTLHVPFGIPAPEFAINIGARIIGTEPSLLLSSSFIVPKRLIDAGYQFKFPKANQALDNLLK